MLNKQINRTVYQNFPVPYRVLFGAECLLIAFIFLLGVNVLGFGGYGGITVAEKPFAPIGLSVLNALSVQVCLLSFGLYNPKFREGLSSILRRISVSVFIAQSAFVFFCTLVPPWSIGYDFFVFLCASNIVSLGLLRYLTLKVDIFNFRKVNVLILGAGERSSIVEKRMRRAVDRQNFNLLGFVPISGDSEEKGIKNETTISLGMDNLIQYVVENDVEEIVIACDDRRQTLPLDELFACRLAGVNVIDILDFIERETGQLAINLMYPSWVIYSKVLSPPNSVRERFDWLFNSFLAIVVFVLTFPFMLLAALAIKIEDGWDAPIFYYQNRVGRNGKIFRIVKFRSMRQNAEANGAVWAKKKDNRTTRVGQFLRKYRVDELPQVYNVLKGDMGFVGPRPERPEMIEGFIHEIPYYDQRHNVKPGLTGWAQLKYPYGASLEDTAEKLKYDLYYVKHRSFLLDLSILLLTAEIVLFGKGR
ncbi:MAG: sugar transferase [Porticoccaceae bacterium]|nr:sugar transferase [Porticoccaceae bacterium]